MEHLSGRFASLVLVSALLAACGTSAPTASRSSTPIPTVLVATRSAAPSPVPVDTLASGGTMFPGTYRTNLDPPMTITINDLVNLDCAPGYRCRGDIDLNTPAWVEFEFGNVHGSDLVIMSIGKVYDADGKTLIDPPADFVAWMLDRPGMRENTPRVPVTIGGIAGTRIDITSSDTKFAGWGPTNLAGDDVPRDFGINGGAGARVRFNVLNVNGHWVLIEESLGPENTVGNFDRVVEDLQGVISSIRWE
jgi:hypothetical protein